MKKWLKNACLFAAVVSMFLILCPVTAKADGWYIRNYQELQEVLAQGIIGWALDPDDNFGWPSEPTTVTLSGDEQITLVNNWTIPSNITVVQDCPVFAGNSSVYVKGNWKVNSYMVPKIVVEEKGTLHVIKDFSLQSLTVKKGGIVNNDTIIAVSEHDNGTLIIEKGAVINGTGKFVLSGGTLQSNGAVIPRITISAYISHKQPAKIKGTVVINGMEMWGDLEPETLLITSGSKVSITNSMFGHGKNQIVVENGSTLELSRSWYESIPADIVVQKGGSFVTDENLVIGNKHTVTIENGATMTVKKQVEIKANSGIIMKSGSRIDTSASTALH